MTQKLFNLTECRIQASILLKQIRTTAKIESGVLFRLKQLPVFKEADESSIVENIKLKHCLYIIAHKNSFKSWNNLRYYFEITSKTNFVFHSGFLNQWFANYKEAKFYLDSNPQDFLLAYKTQFVVCDTNCIEYMGFNSDDLDWLKISHNWVEPEDYSAWERLNLAYSKKLGGK